MCGEMNSPDLAVSVLSLHSAAHDYCSVDFVLFVSLGRAVNGRLITDMIRHSLHPADAQLGHFVFNLSLLSAVKFFRLHSTLVGLVHQSLAGAAPAYLADDCHLLSDAGRRLLRSDSNHIRKLIVP